MLDMVYIVFDQKYIQALQPHPPLTLYHLEYLDDSYTIQ